MNALSTKVLNNVKISGSGDQVLMFAHGFGCNQSVWRFLTEKLRNDYTVVTFDYVGFGQSDVSAFDVARYATLDGYASDIGKILREFDLKDVTLIGHSVSAMIAMQTAIKLPDRIARLVMVCPSPYYMNELPEYEGGFERHDLEELIDMMDKNYIGWANYLAPLVVGSRFSSNLVDELSESFCSTDPRVAKTFAKAAFFSDCRDMLPNCHTPTLVLQSRVDSLAPVKVGQYLSERLPQSVLRILDTHGHCIHMTHPELTEAGIRAFLSDPATLPRKI